MVCFEGDLSFLQYAGVETLWPHGLTVSPWLGTWKEAREVHTAWYGKQYIMRVSFLPPPF